MSRVKKELIEWGITILIAAVIVIVVRTFLFDSFKVDGHSMDPTFKDGDRVIVNKIQDRFTDYENGDLIVFRSEEGPPYVKRIIGIPGDTVTMEEKLVYVNDEPINETYVYYTNDSYMDNFTLEDLGVDAEEIPEDNYLVLGDNRPLSRDSRDFGLIERESIIGEVQLRFWPLNKMTVNFN